jgi:hypothetical protein
VIKGNSTPGRFFSSSRSASEEIILVLFWLKMKIRVIPGARVALGSVIQRGSVGGEGGVLEVLDLKLVVLVRLGVKVRKLIARGVVKRYKSGAGAEGLGQD